jgi:hypothetical protein
MCQCAQRRAVIRQAIAGQVSVGQAATAVVTSLAQDARAARAAALAAAKATLRR